MKLYVYHYRGEELQVPGVTFELGAYWLEIPDAEIGAILLELSKVHDLMLVGPKEKGKHEKEDHPIHKHHQLYIDRKGWRFRQR